MSTQGYDKIRFIGFPIPTTPANLVAIGNPNGPGAVAGTYIGNPDLQTDLQHRIAIMKHAVDQAKAVLPNNEEGVINLFVAPEFFFHGVLGPYVYATPESDPVILLREHLATTFNASAYPNWTFMFGSAITSMIRNVDAVFSATATGVRNAIVKTLAQQWQRAYGPLEAVVFDMLVNFIKNAHAYPSCEVRNRDIIVSNIPIQTFQDNSQTNLMTTEKYYVSNEDFVLYEPSGKDVITEQMTAYPPIDLSAGDAKASPFDVHAIFRQDELDPANPIGSATMNYGIEICLDHSDTRLRRNIDNEPRLDRGIHVQVIPSCGMQIILESVAADADGFVFNCDGQYALNGKRDGKGWINGVNCLFANYTDEKNADYAGHTQLARVRRPARGGDPKAADATNATFRDLDPSAISVFDIHKPPPYLDRYFCGGPGQIHIYGLHRPYALYSSRR